MSNGNVEFSMEDWTELEMNILRHAGRQWGKRGPHDLPFPLTAERLAAKLGTSEEEVETAVSHLWLHLRAFTLGHRSDGKHLDFGTITGLTRDGEKLVQVLLARD
jgi:hypothetical protein